MQAFFIALLSKVGIDAIRELVSAMLQYFKNKQELKRAKVVLKKRIKEIQNEKIPGNLTKREEALIRAKRINDIASSI